MQFDGSWNQALERIVREAVREDRSPAGRVREVADWIAREPALPHGLESLAARAAMSPRNLERWFTRELGMSPARFVQATRVELARRLVEATSLSMKAIARRCGYGNEERMRRAFHRALGVSPRGYAASLATRVAPNG